MRMVPIVLKQGSVFQTGRKDVAASRRTMFGTGDSNPIASGDVSRSPYK
jgi:hypothetical protein